MEYKHLKKCCKNIGYKVVQRGDFLVVFDESGDEMFQVGTKPQHEFITTLKFRSSISCFERGWLLAAIMRDGYESLATRDDYEEV